MSKSTTIFGIVVFCCALSANAFGMYDSNTGRFLQRDPLNYVDGMNVYEYVRSGPVVRSDPLGLWGGGAWPWPAPVPPKPPANTYFWLCNRKMKCFPYLTAHCYVSFGKNPFGGKTKDKDGWGFTKGGAWKEKSFNPAKCRACKVAKKGTLKYGPTGVKDKPCKDASNSNIISCIKNYPPKKKYNTLTYNCKHYAKEAVKNCCLSCGVTWYKKL